MVNTKRGNTMTHLERQEKDITIKDVILDVLLLIMIFGSGILLLAI